MKTLAVLVFSTLVFSATSQAASSATLARMNSSASYLNAIQSIGYESAESFANAYEAAELNAQNKGLDLNLGTLAICGEAKGMLIFMGGEEMICMSLFRVFHVAIRSRGVGINGGFGVGAVYFRDGRPSELRRGDATYVGIGAAIATEIGMAGTVAIQAKSKTDWSPLSIKNAGFFMAFEADLAFAFELKGSLVTVEY